MKKTPDYSAYVEMASPTIGHNSGATSDMLVVTELARRFNKVEQEIIDLEAQLKSKKEELEKISERDIPNKLEQMGVSEITTLDGIKVEVTEYVRGSLTKENQPMGYKWLEDNGYGALLKSEVVVSFGKKEIAEANKLVCELRANKRIANLEKTVHHATLDAFIREQLEDGKDIPLDIFSVFRQRIADVNVKQKKTKKNERE